MSNTKKSLVVCVKKSEAEIVNKSFSDNALRMMKKRYLQKKSDGVQETPAEMFHRIAHTIGDVEKRYGATETQARAFEKDFFGIMSRKEYTPAGRTVTNTGSTTSIVANCIVLPIHDSMDSIFQTLKDAALLQQAGSGLGFALDEMRPAFTPTKRSNGVSSGPISFLKVYDEAFGTIKQQGRHGANMAMMSVSHPDILDFITCKEQEGAIRNFNISIKVTDRFMKQVTEKPDTQWYGEWKGVPMKPQKVIRAPNGSVTGVEPVDITAKELFDKLVHHAWLNGEPGIVFIDEVNRTNPLPALGEIQTSNPCGEQFLHAYDNCNLGSVNLAQFVTKGKIDWKRLEHTVKVAVRMMDDVIDLFDFPVPQVTELAQKNRRIGLGIMGFADMLFQLGIGYNSEKGRKIGEEVMTRVNAAAHAMSEELARKKGVFPNAGLSIYKNKKTKPRNAALTTVAPTGSISMMFDCSSGIEPNFALAFVKQDKDGIKYHYFNEYFEKALKASGLSTAKQKAVKEELVKTGSIQNLPHLPETLRKTFVVAMDISAQDHMKMQAAFQRHVDNSISKTINFPNSATEEEVFDGFVSAWREKCKSCTVYRDGSREVQILNLGTGEGLKAPSEIGAMPKSTIKEFTTPHLAIDKGRLEVRKRPEVMNGKTYKVKTGYGTLYVTVNNDEQGIPFEVFATIGKSGGFFQEQSEGICRLISLSLRSGVKVEEVIEHLKGIRGPMPMMTNKGTILSLPDAIGQILEEHVQAPTISAMLPQETKETASVAATTSTEPHIGFVASKKSIADYGMMPGCPDCGSPLQMAEGCMSCKSCGFSRCM